MSEIKERLAHVMDRIEAARKRSPYGQKVTLVAVTKFHPLEDMEEAIHLGVTQVGENRVQEMEEKYKDFRDFNKWELKPAINELNQKTHYSITIQLLKTLRRVTHIQFYFSIVT